MPMDAFWRLSGRLHVQCTKGDAGEGGFPSMGIPQKRWMVYNGNPTKTDDLGLPIFWETIM